MSRYAKIAGVGSYVPEKILTNADLEKMVETSDEWIRTRTGIQERHICAEGQSCSDLAFEASRKALEHAGLKAEDLDLIITATVSPDRLFPSTACFVQDKLQAYQAAAFDLGAACSGFVYALSVAQAFIESGAYQNILVIGAEAFSSFVDWKDRSTCVLFGDGAGAAVLKPSEGPARLYPGILGADGRSAELLHIPAGGSAMPPSHETLDQGLHSIKMMGNEVFKVAVKSMSDAVLELLRRNQLELEQVACVIPHQANIRIINAVAKRLGVSEDKVYVNVQHYGNTSAATIPIALDEVIREGVAGSGDYLVLVAFGAGFTSGASLIQL